MVTELRQIVWMQRQWKRFCRLVWGSAGAVWMLCGSGILLLPEEAFIVRMALLVMLIISAVLTIYLLVAARRERQRLDRLTIEMRALQQQEKDQKSAPPPS